MEIMINSGKIIWLIFYLTSFTELVADVPDNFPRSAVVDSQHSAYGPLEDLHSFFHQKSVQFSFDTPGANLDIGRKYRLKIIISIHFGFSVRLSNGDLLRFPWDFSYSPDYPNYAIRSHTFKTNTIKWDGGDLSFNSISLDSVQRKISRDIRKATENLSEVGKITSWYLRDYRIKVTLEKRVKPCRTAWRPIFKNCSLYWHADDNGVWFYIANRILRTDTTTVYQNENFTMEFESRLVDE